MYVLTCVHLYPMFDMQEEDNHTYYTSEYYASDNPVAQSLWMDLASMVGDGVVVDDEDLQESELSGLHRYFEVCACVSACSYNAP